MSKCLTFLVLSLIAFAANSQDPDRWEERQTRLQPPEIVIGAMGLEKGMIVGEIGAGRGRYSVILAEHVGDEGHIFANDIAEEDLEYLDFRCERDHIGNITTIVGEEKDPKLPTNKLDMLFMVNTYHHISDPVSVLKNAYPALKRSGTLVIIEGVPGRGGTYSGHSTPKKKILREVEEAGFKFDRIAAELSKDDIYIFRK
jgi:ubiquinone/menaquinone biosynthesis C-methylase UbiE